MDEMKKKTRWMLVIELAIYFALAISVALLIII